MNPRVVNPPSGFDPGVAPLIWMLEDSRSRSLQTLSGLGDIDLTWAPEDTGGNSIGTVLYHLAAIEADWLAGEVLELPAIPAEIMSLFPHDVRDAEGRLIADRGSLYEHLRRLEAVRRWLLDAFRGIDLAELRRPRNLPDYDVTPEWVLHHLMQHEAEHRGEIGLIGILAPPRTI